MPTIFDGKLVVAISSRALFDLDESHEIYERDGVDAYTKHQIAHEDQPLDPGVAFSLVKKLLALNHDCPDHPVIEVILLSRNSADTGLRVFNSIKHHGWRQHVALRRFIWRPSVFINQPGRCAGRLGWRPCSGYRADLNSIDQCDSTAANCVRWRRGSFF